MKDFNFGVGVSSYQIEGAPTFLNKIPSIWDIFSHKEGKIKDNSTGDKAIEFIKRYKEDIKLIKELGVDSFRFSISWGRVIKKDGTPNKEGINLYLHIIDEIKKNGLRPVVTLYHWDLPQCLEELGGWENRNIVDWFGNYVDVITSSIGDKVDEYITINEPQCILNCGYLYGNHAPGKNVSIYELLKMTHYLLLAHAKAYKIIKKNNPHAKASIVSCGDVSVPTSLQFEEEARRHYFRLNKDNLQSVSLFLDPIFLGDYPSSYYDIFKGHYDFIEENDLDYIKGTSDICYQNIYTGVYVGKDKEKMIYDKGDLEWLRIIPSTLYYGPKFLFERYHRPIVISENGLSTEDNLIDNKIDDEKRIKYIKEYFENLMKAKEEGIDIKGYYYWSIFDNFEWAEGYTSRFGLIYIDYKTQTRYKKNSYYFYKSLIEKYKNEEI